MNGLTSLVQWVPRTTEVNYASFQSPPEAGYEQLSEIVFNFPRQIYFINTY